VSLNSQAIYDAIQSDALKLGLFESVRSHEAINPPGNGLTVDIWTVSLGPSRSSGLAQASVILTLMVRVRCPLDQEPRDAIDPNLTDAVNTLIGQWSGDFSLGSNARAIDILGQESRGVAAAWGHVNAGGKLFRVADITVPIIVNDAWTESP